MSPVGIIGFTQVREIARARAGVRRARLAAMAYEVLDPDDLADATGGKLTKQEPAPELLAVVKQLVEVTDKVSTAVRASQDQAQQQSSQMMMQMLPQLRGR